MSDSTTSLPEQKRPVLHKLIDELPADELVLVERLLARLEMDRLWKNIQSGFTQDWEEGNYDRLDAIIQEVRQELNHRPA